MDEQAEIKTAANMADFLAAAVELTGQARIEYVREAVSDGDQDEHVLVTKNGRVWIVIVQGAKFVDEGPPGAAPRP